MKIFELLSGEPDTQPANQSTPYMRGGGDVVIPPPPRRDDDEGQDQTYLQNQARKREETLPKPYDNMKYRFASDDLSQGDFVVGMNRNPKVGDKDIQNGVWTGGQAARFNYPISPYTNPFGTPEYGVQSSPSNPVLSDSPPEIPPGYSETRGAHSRYVPGAPNQPGLAAKTPSQVPPAPNVGQPGVPKTPYSGQVTAPPPSPVPATPQNTVSAPVKPQPPAQTTPPFPAPVKPEQPPAQTIPPTPTK